MGDDFDELLYLANREHEQRKELIEDLMGGMYPENPCTLWHL